MSDGKRVHGNYEFGEWHYGIRTLFVFLYNENFYNENFIRKVQNILSVQQNPAYAQFECYDSNAYMLYGCCMVFKNNVIFDRLSEESGLIKRLIRI